jgi:site-specific DNA recombinase
VRDQPGRGEAAGGQGRCRDSGQPGGGLLAAWAGESGRRRTGSPAGGGSRFAFYGRVSTEDWQDPVTSLGRQREQAGALVRGHGRIVEEFCDVGESRSVAWGRRPQTAELIAALADQGRGWDAIVVGSTSGRFTAASTRWSLRCCSITASSCGCRRRAGRLRLGARRAGDDRAGAVVEAGVARTSIRVRTAMAAQTREQGRYLGGRPPYGYRLGDAGPHPNKAHAAWGRRAHRLEPDPETAHVVRWVFAQRLAGHSVARIARALNEAGIPCPSAADPSRNPHRPGTGWTLGTVTTILANPRYTGRQVWNRQRTDKDLADPADVSLGHKGVQRWNLPDGWVISRKPAHPALVSEADYIAAQNVRAARGPTPRNDIAGPGRRRYQLAGLLVCGTCGRRMESAWSNGKTAYRCRHGRTTASARSPEPLRNAYVREDRILPHLPALHVLLTSPADGEGDGPRRRRTRRGIDTRCQATPEAVTAYLREQSISLTYDPATSTLYAGTGDAAQAITLKAS